MFKCIKKNFSGHKLCNKYETTEKSEVVKSSLYLTDIFFSKIYWEGNINVPTHVGEILILYNL